MALKLRPFLTEMVEVLREDYPGHLARIVSDAQGLTYLQVLDTEKAIIKVRDNKIKITGVAKQSEINVRIYTSRDCLFKVLEGRLTLDEALDNGELRVFGDALTLLRCYSIWERIISLARTSPRFYFLTYRLR